MTVLLRTVASVRRSLSLAALAVRAWTARQVVAAVVATAAVGLVIGVATVLVPNPLFGREIAPVAWNYPVWVLAAVLSGMLAATYVRPWRAPRGGDVAPDSARPDPRAPEGDCTPESGTGSDDVGDRRTGPLGLAGAVLAWFAVGCPVCNKLALLALGYTGALTWFAPVQPVLAGVAVALSAVALVLRLRGQVACPVPGVPGPEPREREVAR